MQSAGKKTLSLAHLSMLMITLSICASPAFAGFYTTVEIRETYEDNVSGLVTDNPNTAIADGNVTTQTPVPVDDNGGGGNGHSGRGAPVIMRTHVVPGDPSSGATQKDGDFSTEFYANIGYLNKIDTSTSLFVQASFQDTSYADFDQFDFTIFGMSAGARRRLSDIFSTRVAFDVKSKDYDNPLRSGTALGAKISLTEKLGPVFWAREFYGYEWNNADSAIYSYGGHSLGIRAGLDFTALWSVEAGYSYLLRQYDEPSGYEVTSNTISAALTRRFGDYWSAILGFDQETSRENFFDTSSTNNIFSVAIQFFY